MMRWNWPGRLHRYGVLARAPLNFLRAQTYREAMFLGLGRGESFLRAGSSRIGAHGIATDLPLPLVVGGVEPAVCLVVSSIVGEDVRSALAELLAAGVAVRLVAVNEPVRDHEYALRAWLAAQLHVPIGSQARLQVIDGATGVVAVSSKEVFVCAADQAALLRTRLAERSMANPVHGLTGLSQALADLPPAGPSPWPERSRLGLGYRVLKPLAEDSRTGRTCLFAHFDPDGRIDPHVLRYLAELKTCGFDTVLISACPLEPAAFAAAAALTVAAISRQNKGLDFSGWALAMELFPRLLDSETLILANDSVYAPVGALSPMLDRMDRSPFDVWGAVESFDVDRHVQSWFVCFRQSALRSPAFARFWADVLPLDDKSAVIGRYEIPLWRRFEAEGLKLGAAFGVAEHRHIGLNPTMDDWRAVLEAGAPFVKVQLLRDNPLGVCLDGWAQALSQRGYPPHLVLDHLYRVKGAEAAALKTS